MSANEKMNVKVELPLTYLHTQKGSGKPLLLFFHGYSDNGSSLVRRMFVTPDERFEILAPNGLFPMPVRTDDGWKEAYAWYFYDPESDTMLVPPSVSISALSQLLKKLGLENRDKVVVGFSQGGFFFPRALSILKNVKKAIGVGCGYQVEDYPENPGFPVDAIHGEDDKVISHAKSSEAYKKLAEKNIQGKFVSIKGLGHTMNGEAREVFKNMIGEIF